MTATPDMSIVVCSYNRADRLGATLRALERQTIRDRLEIVIVDDGSSPSVDRCEVSRNGAKLVRHAMNRGPAAARNSGAAASSAPIVAFTDDDCRPAPEWASSLLVRVSRTGMSEQQVAQLSDRAKPGTSSVTSPASSRSAPSRQRSGAVRRCCTASGSMPARTSPRGCPPESATPISLPAPTSRSDGRSSKPSAASTIGSASEKTGISAIGCT